MVNIHYLFYARQDSTLHTKENHCQTPAFLGRPLSLFMRMRHLWLTLRAPVPSAIMRIIHFFVIKIMKTYSLLLILTIIYVSAQFQP
jgi:hypothetical protein